MLPSPRHDAKGKPLGRSCPPVDVRVIAGALKGRRLVTPRGATTRPTADQVRIALMDTLGPWLPDARVLDLFAGAGGVGLEALSRGA
ncbi:MAG TPA: RsmD family RNA methyltransferase, partial [Candidatus Binatia bacterium]|nr:RsmD family RNA methyltransferase [Candidatus Binatia bacterium]